MSRFRQLLARVLGPENVLDDPGDCWPYGYDNSRRHAPPDLVGFAATHEQVKDVVRLCNEQLVPLIARGRGTGTTGGTVPLRGGLVLSLERMDRVIDVDADNRVAVVEPGTTNQSLQDAATRKGFFWPPDPTSATYCTVGGNLAYNSAGPRAVKYGTPRENTLGLRAITGDGREIRTGVYTTKGVVGYDLTRLLIGSEGTLAVITEATLKLTPLPQARRAMTAAYAHVQDAARAIARIMALSVTPSILEFVDAAGIELVRGHAAVQLPEGTGSLLMLEVDGPADCIQAAVEAIRWAATGPGLLEFAAANGPGQVDQLWAARKALSPAMRELAPNKINEDVVVPVSRIPDLIDGLAGLSERYRIPIVSFGHAGNGNLHVTLLVDPEDPQQIRGAQACVQALFRLVLHLHGTLSGEHGIGIEKRDYIGLEIEPVTLELMRRIKRQFDPNGILTPGKVFPVTPDS
jgi:D-lactate dehydrogenase